MLKARVKKDSRFAPVTSCSGISFFRDSWTNVPLGFEKEAKANPYLETKEFDDEEEVVAEVISPEIVEVEPEIIETEPVPDEINATESAIALAKEMRIKLSWVTGTGKNNKILQKDIEDYLSINTKG
jgi:pyruvate/2-oxoglutarate dehydrogenase complex dihydrolipoamide acyltransferase (E2) component